MKRRKDTKADLCLQRHLTELGFKWGREWRFDNTRRWRIDYVILKGADDDVVAGLEIDGGQFGGGHKRGFVSKADRLRGKVKTPLEEDNDKTNMLAIMGIKVLHFTPQQIERGEAYEFIKKWFLSFPEQEVTGAPLYKS